jgi:hypothetical protein
MARRNVGAGVVVTAATSAAIFAWLFRDAPQPDGVVADASPPPAQIDLEQPWVMHTIVEGTPGAGNFHGADGVDLADVNGDGRLDVTTPYEQGARVSVSILPPAGPGAPWPTVITPSTQIAGPEDAVWGDVDGDGALDVVIGSEGSPPRVVVNFGPVDPANDTVILTAGNWTRVNVDASTGWRSMRIALADVAGDDSLEIIVGGKEGGSGGDGEAALAYYESETPRTAASWTKVDIEPVGWVQQMYVLDVDGDLDLDIVYNDKDMITNPSNDGTRVGVRWLENDGADPPDFTAHPISAVEEEHRWFSLADWEGDGDLDIVGCRSSVVLQESYLLLLEGDWIDWEEVVIPQPSNVSRCTHAQIVDVDQDGVNDVAFSYFNADGNAFSDTFSSLVWLRNTGSEASPAWARGEISGTELGVKYDNVIWYDVDADGDLDAVTSEQSEDIDDNEVIGPGLGVVWYENPL